MKKKILTILVVIFLTGCSSTERRGGESLSSVMEKSRSSSLSKEVDDGEEHESFFGALISELLFSGWSCDDEKKDKINIKEKSTYKYVEQPANVIGKQEIKNRDINTEKAELPPVFHKGILLSISRGTTYYTGKDIKSIEKTVLSLKKESYNRDFKYEFGIVFGRYDLKKSFKYSDAVDCDFVSGVELQVKGKAKEINKNASINLGMGLGYNITSWEYLNSLKTDERVITRDNIENLRLFTICGLEYLWKSGRYLNLEICPEAIFPTLHTGNGFKNDVFDEHLGLGYRIEIGQYF